MKLTLEHTDTMPGEKSRKATVEIGSDFLTMDEIWTDLIRPALLAMTFAESTVDCFFPSFEKDDDIEADEPEPVVDTLAQYRTRDGREVTGLRHTGDDKWCIHGYIGGCKISWMANGSWSAFDTEHALDLIPTGEVAL